MAEDSGSERSESATGKRREKALEEGQVALSQEVNGVLVLLLAFSLLFVVGGYMSRVLGENSRYLFGQAHIFLIDDPYALVEIATSNLTVIIKALAPIMFTVLVAGFAANVLQVGWNVNVSAMNFRWSKMNPVSGMKQIFSKKSGFEMVKNILKIAIISSMAWLTISGVLGEVVGTSMLTLDGAADVGKSTMMTLVYRMLALISILAVADWAYQKWQHEEDLKMTKQEVKEESKDMEGDPQIKARIRSMQIENLRRRMMNAVPTADVVVTNPTHFAVALKYTPGDPAPKVVAKGADHMARHIKAIARENRVPIIENKPLARALHKVVEIGAHIPDELYKAVAEVLAYVYRLKKS